MYFIRNCLQITFKWFVSVTYTILFGLTLAALLLGQRFLVFSSPALCFGQTGVTRYMVRVVERWTDVFKTANIYGNYLKKTNYVTILD